MSTSPKGFPQIAGTNPPNGPAQINAAELFVENLIGESVASVSNLPASGNWFNRQIMAQDTGIVYFWIGTAWKKITDVDDTGWIQAGASGGPVLAAGWTNQVAANIPWNGIQARMRNGVVSIEGPAGKSTFASLETMCTMPVGWRPSVTIVALMSSGYGIIRPDGTVAPALGGGGNISVGATYPV